MNCILCLKPLIRRPGERTVRWNKRKYCDYSCSLKARWESGEFSERNNYGRKPGSKNTGGRKPVPNYCFTCGVEIPRKPNRRRNKNCENCRWIHHSKVLKAYYVNNPKPNALTTLTLKECKEKSKWYLQNIHSHSCSSFEGSRYCYYCNYQTHAEICHIKGITEFEDSALIGEINARENLIPLCPTHHWEFDNGHLTLEQIKQSEYYPK